LDRPRSISIAVHGEQFLTELLNHGRSELTAKTYRFRLDQFEAWRAAVGCAVHDVKPGTLEQWIVDLRGRGLAMKTIHDNVGAVRSFYDWLEGAGYLEVDPLRRFRSIKVPERLPDVLQVETVVQILIAGERCSPLSRAIVEVLYGCGLRTGDLQRLNVDSVDLVGPVVKAELKGKKQRYIPMNAKAAAAVRLWLGERQQLLDVWQAKRDRAEELHRKGLSYRQIAAAMGVSGPTALKYVAQSKNSRPVERALFIGRQGRLKASQIRTIVKQVAAAAGVDRRVYPHLFRHSVATHLHDNGMDIRTVQKFLGHSKLGTTEIYTHVAIAKLRSEYDRTHPRGGDLAPR
jgi:integrase/recombinase XerC